jgi:hypothetical protein
MSSAAEAFQQFLIEPVRKRSAALFVLQLAQLVTDRGRGRYDALMQRALSVLKPKIALPPSQLMDEHSIASSVATLKTLGWNILPFRLPSSDLAELRHFAFATPAYAANPGDHITITEAEIPHTEPRYMWRMSDLIRVPAVQRLICDAALHRIAQDYIGCQPTLTSVTLWLDPVYEGQVYDAHIYHYDNDGPSFLKFFIYISDVDAETGAHTFIQGSHTRPKPVPFGRSSRYNRHELLNFYGTENEIIFTGPAGLILAEDTAGFHKGTTLKKDYRLLLQLEYATLDIPHEEEFDLGLDRAPLAGLNPGIRKIAKKFFK